jgi:hypothetical protein
MSTSLGEQLFSARSHIEEAHKESLKMYTLLQETQAKCVKKITEHHKKTQLKKQIEAEQVKKLEQELFSCQDDIGDDTSAMFDSYFDFYPKGDENANNQNTNENSNVDGQDSENQSTDANNTKDTNVPSMNLM